MALWIWPIKVDGDFGSYTQECFQRFLKYAGYYKRAIDGSFGAQSYISLQKFLKSRGFYSGAIDGKPGKLTWGGWYDYMLKYNYWDSGNWYNSKTKHKIGIGLCRTTQRALNNFRVRYEWKPVDQGGTTGF